MVRQLVVLDCDFSLNLVFMLSSTAKVPIIQAMYDTVVRVLIVTVVIALLTSSTV